MINGAVELGQSLEAEIDNGLRQSIVLNHSATHLLHAALRSILGEHVTQKGSLVDSEKLRFDFSHTEAVSAEALKEIEHKVNAEIRRNTAVETQLCSMDEAKEKGAMMLFGEKYGSEVRVLSMGDGFSVELCGGTHVKRTGDIGLFHIVSESGIAAGVRRIEAITGSKALSAFDDAQARLQQASSIIKANPASLLDKLEQLVSQSKQQEQQLAELQSKMASAASGDLLKNVTDIAGVPVLLHKVDGVDAKVLRKLAETVKSKLESGLFLLAGVNSGKVALIAGVSKDLSGQYKAGDLMKLVAPLVGGNGGGRPDMAQGSGTQPENLEKAFKAAEEWVNNE